MFTFSNTQVENAQDFSQKEEFAKFWQEASTKDILRTSYDEFFSKLDDVFIILKEKGFNMNGKQSGDVIFHEISRIRAEMDKEHKKNAKYLEFIPRNPISGALYTVGAVVGGTLGSVCLPFVGAYLGGKKGYESTDKNMFVKVGMTITGTIAGLIGGTLALPVGVVGSVTTGAAAPIVGTTVFADQLACGSLESQLEQKHKDIMSVMDLEKILESLKNDDLSVSKTIATAAFNS